MLGMNKIKRGEIRNTTKLENGPSGSADRFKHKEESFTVGGGVVQVPLLWGLWRCGALLAPNTHKNPGSG